MVGFPVDTPVAVIVVDRAVFSRESALYVVIPFAVIVVDKVGANR